MPTSRKPSVVTPAAQRRDAGTASPNLEQYVETIAYLLTQDKVCTVSEIAGLAQVTRAAASRAVKELADKDLVTHRTYGYVDLTEEGRGLAAQLAARHHTLQRFLEQVLAFDSETADREACRLEHQVDDELARRIDLLNGLVSGDSKLMQALHRKMKA
jgi:DtxR family Mn-dependent transcriptional regulator